MYTLLATTAVLMIIYIFNYTSPLQGFKSKIVDKNIEVVGEGGFVPRKVIVNTIAFSSNSAYTEKYKRILMLPVSHFYMSKDMQAELFFGYDLNLLDSPMRKKITIIDSSITLF